jgi:transcription elongation factor GreA-like protein
MKTKFHITVETVHPVNQELQMEMLAYVRNSLRNFTSNYPETKLVVTKEVSNEDLMEAIRSDNQSREQCFYYDEAQGRHKCTNDLVKSNKCNGVCKDYKAKNNF